MSAVQTVLHEFHRKTVTEMFLFAVKDEAIEVRKANIRKLSEPEISA
jgi:hypothetical protein